MTETAVRPLAYIQVKRPKVAAKTAVLSNTSTPAAKLRCGVSLLMALGATLPASVNAIMVRTSVMTGVARFLIIGAVAFILTRVLVSAFSPRVIHNGVAPNSDMRLTVPVTGGLQKISSHLIDPSL